MKICALILGVLSVVGVCYGYSSRNIGDAKAEECFKGVCQTICSYEGINLLPGRSQYNHGKCNGFVCNKDFSITVNGLVTVLWILIC